MTVSSGFFNSVSGDRKYNAQHFNEIFDGLLSDGVYVNWGDAFKVTPGTGLQVIVGSGRGWFKNTWILNDAALPITISDAADPTYPRIDAIVIDINIGTSVRNNTIKRVMGTAASTPDKPTLANEPTHKQYPIAWVRINAGATSITATNITDCQLTGELPAIEALLEYSSHTKAQIDERIGKIEDPTFTEAQNVANIASQDNINIMWGKIQKMFSTIINRLPVQYGGTGRNIHTTNSIIVGNGTSAVKNIASNRGAFKSSGAGAEPSFGILPIDMGGTGQTTAAGVRNALGLGNTTGALPIANGGTGGNSVASARNNLGLGNTSGALPIANGGTGATTAAQALTNLGVPSDVAKAMSKDVYCSQDENRSIIDLAHGGTGSNDGTINGVRLAKSGSNMGYYDANGNFKTFRQPTGNAEAGDVLSGKTFANASSDAVTGIMTDYTNMKQTVTPTGGSGNETLELPSGKHNGVIVNRTAPYNKGVMQAQSITWTETIRHSSIVIGTSGKDVGGTAYAEIDLTNVTSIKCSGISTTSGYGIYKYEFLNSAKSYISGGNFSNGTTFSIPAGAKYFKTSVDIEISSLSSAISTTVTFTIGRQAKTLR
jgi:hypothetical protein